MKNQLKLSSFAIAIILLVSGISAFAQEQSDFLPTSTNSAEAKQLYAKAIDRLVNADYEKYEQLMSDAVKTDPNYFMAQSHLALNALMEEQSKKNNNPEMEKALAIPESNLTDAEKQVRKILVKINEDPKADLTPLTDQLVSSYPDKREAWGLSRAIAAQIENDKDASFKYAQQLVTLDPEFGPGHNILGYAYMDMGQMDKAKHEFEEYLRLSPNEANAHDSMGEFYMANGDYNKSAEHYNKAVAMGMKASEKNARKATAMAKGNIKDKDQKTAESKVNEESDNR